MLEVMKLWGSKSQMMDSPLEAIPASISGPICSLVSVLCEVAGQVPTAVDQAAIPCHLSSNELYSTKTQTLPPKLLLPRILPHLHGKEVVHDKIQSIYQAIHNTSMDGPFSCPCHVVNLVLTHTLRILT